MIEPNLISEATVGREEIEPIIDLVEKVLEGAPRTHVLIALTSIILLLQHPNITPEQIYEGVKDTSRFICTWLADLDAAGEPIDKSKMN
jgi:hypothetical protein